MKNFRTLDQAKKDMQVYLDYIHLIENYEPTNFTQHVIKAYALDGNITRTAEVLNQQGFQVQDRPLESQDIREAIISKPNQEDALHKEVRKLYLKRINSKKLSAKPYSYR